MEIDEICHGFFWKLPSKLHEASMEVNLTSMEVPWKVNFHEREFERCLTSMKEVYVILISASMKAAMYFRGGSAWKTCASANAHTKP